MNTDNYNGLGQMPVLSCPNFFDDLYHSRRKCLNTNKYLGRSNYLSNYLHLKIQTPSGVARGEQLLPGAARRGGGRQNTAKEFFKIYIRRNFKRSEKIK